MSPISPEAERRRRLVTRALPIALLAIIAILVVMAGDGDELSAARRFAEGWERQDFAAMYGEISPQSARRYSLAGWENDA